VVAVYCLDMYALLYASLIFSMQPKAGTLNVQISTSAG